MELPEKIVAAMQEIFSTMVMMEVEAGEPGQIPPSPLVESISGVIGLAGTHKGVLAIHLPNRVAMAITGSFLGMEVDEINSDVEDAVGELANMLGGNVKSILSEKGRDIDLSLPTTISGREYGFQSAREVEKILLPFVCAEGNFFVELQLER